MRYLVEARYLNHQPSLRILDAQSRRVILQWELHQIRELIDSGDIKEEDFLHPEKYGLQLLVKNLFLLSCADRLNTESDVQQEVNPYLSYRFLGDSDICGRIK